MTVDSFGGVPVSNYRSDLAWYERLLGSEPAFIPHATEAVWDGVRKVVYRDLDGKEVSFGGGPARATDAS